MADVDIQLFRKVTTPTDAAQDVNEREWTHLWKVDTTPTATVALTNFCFRTLPSNIVNTAKVKIN